jgi:hypothetical protein
MSNMILVGTRKGTVIFDRTNGTWQPRPITHAGIPVCYLARDPRDGAIWASLDMDTGDPSFRARVMGVPLGKM